MSHIGDKTNLQQPSTECLCCKYWINLTMLHGRLQIGGYCKLGYCKVCRKSLKEKNKRY